jgi:hypothetical protein
MPVEDPVNLRRRLATVAAAALVLTGGVFVATASEAAVIGTAGTFVSAASNRCLTVLGASTTRGSGIVVFDCNGGANQQWTLTAAKELRVYSGGDVKCLDADAWGTANDTKLITWDCTGGTNQQWDLLADGTLKGVHSGKCVDVAGGDRVAGNNNPVILYTCHALGNQRWKQSADNGSGTTACASSAVPARSGLLQTTITNNTGRAGAVYLYVLGGMGGRLGWVNSGGGFNAWPAGGLPPTPAPDAAIAGPGNGASVQIRIPRNLTSGRVYMSIGKKIDFRLTPDGLVQPAPWAGADPNKDVLFDTSEFTFNNDGLWLNSSQVDMFSIPHIVTVTDGAGKTVCQVGLLKRKVIR